MKEKDIELLKQIAEVEDSLASESLPAKLGWRSRDVGIWPGTLISALRPSTVGRDTIAPGVLVNFRRKLCYN